MNTSMCHSDILSIGQTDIDFRHAHKVPQKLEATVWSRVKEALDDAGHVSTQARAAKIAGVKQSSVSDWNKVGKYPTLESAAAIATATNTCVEWIMTGRGPKHPGPPEERAASELWSLWGRLSDLMKGELLGMAKAEIGSAVRSRKSDELHGRSSGKAASGI